MSHSYELKICIEDDNVYEMYKTQIKEHNNKYHIRNDSGFDVFCPYNVKHKNGTELVDLGIKCAMYKKTSVPTPHGTLIKTLVEPSAYYLYPRSSIYKTSYRQANSVGIIDSGYRGPLKAAMDFYPHKEFVPLKERKRYWQICSPDLTPINSIIIVDNLDETVRGVGGHGSTGQWEIPVINI